MSGIQMINKRASRSTSSERSSSGTLRRELWLRDGDQAFLASVATGEDDDPFLEEYWMHTFREDNTFKSILSGPDGALGKVPADSRPQHKFGFWAYITEVYHTESRVDTWEPVTGASGKTMYKEEVNDFRIIPLSFGRGNNIWNQLVDVYNDWGHLSKGIIRIRRSGTGLDTTYTITATTKEDDIPESKHIEISDLPSVKDYLMQTYTESGSSESEEKASVPDSGVSLEDDDSDDLPF